MKKAAFQVLTVALLASLLVSYALPTLADEEPEMPIGEQKAWEAFGPEEKATVIVWKYEDADGNLSTTDDWIPIDWNVYLTNGTYTDELFALGADGSITFDGQEPSSESIDRIVTVVEDDDPAWVHLNDTTSWTQAVKSGETYTVKFVNFKETSGEAPAPASSEGDPEEDDGPPEGVPKGPKKDKGPKEKGPKSRKPPKVRYGQRGNSNVAHIYLFEKDPETWEIVRGRGRTRWAKIKFTLTGDEFQYHINAHGLTAEEAYSLIYYPDPWPGEGLISLGNGTVNNGGNLHLSGSVDTGDLPIEDDKNNLGNPDRYEYIDEDYNGAKLWLVFSTDVDFQNQRMIGWQPAGYLFEYDLITFDDTSD
jgi:hypothetical protein